MKSLTTLDISHNEIGDLGICDVVTNLFNNNINLEEINLSGNFICKNFNYFSKYSDKLVTYFTTSSRLHTIRLGYNNLRGSSNGHVDKLLQSFIEIGTIKTIDLQNNLLGKTFGP